MVKSIKNYQTEKKKQKNWNEKALIIHLLFFLGAWLEKKRRALGFARTDLKLDKYESETSCFPAPTDVT